MTQITMKEFAEAIKTFGLVPKCIVEIGTLHAKDALYLKSQFPDARTIAIEGSPLNWKKYKLDDITEVECYNVVIYKDEREVPYHLINEGTNDGGGSGIYNRYGTGVADYQRLVSSTGKGITDTIRVNSLSLTTFCRQHQIDSIDAIKIDVEGATLDVLLGISKELLDTCKIMHIETEDVMYFEGQPLKDSVSNFLLENGYFCHMSRQVVTGQYDEIWVKR